MRSGRVGQLLCWLSAVVLCIVWMFPSFCKDQHFRFDSSPLLRHEILKPLKTLQQKCSIFQGYKSYIMLSIAFSYFLNRRFDTENSGFIRREDLFKVLENESEALQVMKELDVNNDGKISYEEFIGTSENNCTV